MDAHNLAVVFTPNLVSNDDPARAMQICAIPSGVGSLPSTPPEMTLGIVVKMFIEHYYDLFDEVRDVSEATAQTVFQPEHIEASVRGRSPSPGSPIVVTPPHSSSPPPPSAWGASNSGSYKPRVRSPKRPSTTPSMAMLAKALANAKTSPIEFVEPPLDRNTRLEPVATLAPPITDAQRSVSRAKSVSLFSGGVVSSGGTWHMPKARSVISIEKSSGGAGNSGGLRNGRESIRLGKGTVTSGGTVRKSSSAGVIGVSVTAAGFFAPPEGRS